MTGVDAYESRIITSASDLGTSSIRFRIRLLLHWCYPGSYRRGCSERAVAQTSLLLAEISKSWISFISVTKTVVYMLRVVKDSVKHINSKEKLASKQRPTRRSIATKHREGLHQRPEKESNMEQHSRTGKTRDERKWA